MKLRDMMFLVIGGLLVISGMVLNTLLSGDVEAQVGGDNTFLKNVFCENLVIKDKNGKWRGLFGLAQGNAILEIYGDDGKTNVAYVGSNPNESNKEMNFYLTSKSKTDKRMVVMMINENGGRFDSWNKMGESVATIAVGSDGGGGVVTTDKFGYKR